MSNVMGLHAGGMALQGSAAVGRVRLGSRVLEWLFTALLWTLIALVAVMAGAMLAYTGPHLQVMPHNFELTESNVALPGGVIVGTLPFSNKLAYALAAVVRTAPAIMIFWHLRALFRLYGQGVVFAPGNSGHIQKVGLWLVAAAFTPFLCHLALSVTGNEIDKTWFHVDEVQELVLGALVFVIAAVMQVGREIEEDRSQFV